MHAVFEHNGIYLHYESLGYGDPIVFCHGLAGDRGAMKDLLGPLRGHQLIVWDCCGHGESGPTGPSERYTFSSFAGDLRSLLDHLGIRRAIIGGVSMGAALSAHYAVRWPDRVRALIAVRPAWVDRPLTKNLCLFPVIAELLVRYGPVQGLEEFRRMPEVQELQACCSYTFDSLCHHFIVAQAVDRSVRLDRMPRDVPINGWGAVRELRMPALVVGNENDLIHPLEFAVQWAEHLTNGELVLIESKAVDEEKHVDSFRFRLRAFLSDLGI